MMQEVSIWALNRDLCCPSLDFFMAFCLLSSPLYPSLSQGTEGCRCLMWSLMATLPLLATLILLPIKLSGVPVGYAERDRVPILNKLIWLWVG